MAWKITSFSIDDDGIVTVTVEEVDAAGNPTGVTAYGQVNKDNPNWISILLRQISQQVQQQRSKANKEILLKQQLEQALTTLSGV